MAGDSVWSKLFLKMTIPYNDRSREVLCLVSTSFFSGRENVYRYAHFFFCWLTSSYVEASNKMTASCMFCVLQHGSWVRMVVQALTCS